MGASHRRGAVNFRKVGIFHGCDRERRRQPRGSGADPEGASWHRSCERLWYDFLFTHRNAAVGLANVRQAFFET